ncbi:MAG: flavin reductase family protein [Rhodospirillales bacterium]|nr:flavin reductase family protein [Rhodospirillales bacterium]MBT4039100.1 flavin reductase family protein [Rhodospirillales bacterium]MBT4625501.1 flavin reductase family protein [Rhodospirillales bacterium]MBT5352139.1 flavin reductase family protein [Rhodospirillales bacterium]MBT5521908.1 flavin reductase family protein [Rhodospirillales bacterium]
MTIDTKELRFAFGNFATGITIVTSLDADGEPLGITANSFSSVSLDPPLVLFSVDRGAYSLEAFQISRRFAINILSTDQEDMSNRFAKASVDKWSGVDFETWETGCPILTGSLASFDCRTWQTYDGGDHVIFVGEVEQMSLNTDLEPLLFFRGRYDRVLGKS